MIFVVSLPALLANVRYKWLANGSLGSEESTGITQVGTFLVFRISSTPPANAEELFIYDSTDESNYTTAKFAHLPTGEVSVDIEAMATAMWDELLTGHLIAGSSGATLNGLAVSIAAINPSEVTIVSPVSRTGNKITVRAGDTWILPVAGLGNISTRTKLWFAVNAPGADDSAAKLFIEETDGLTIVNGNDEFGPPELGSITVIDETTGSISIAVDEIATGQLSGTTFWAIKALKADGTAVTLSTGSFVITKPGIEAIT
jgi:hypothetical protein